MAIESHTPDDSGANDRRGLQVAIVATAFFGNFLMANFGNSFNVLLLPVATSLHASADTMRFIGSLTIMALSLGALPCGFLLDRFAVIAVMLVATILTAGGYAVLAMSDSLALFGAAAVLIISLPGAAIGTASATKLILTTLSFRPGTNLAIAASGVSAAGILLPPFSAWLTELAGWRSTYAVFSVTAALFIVPLLLIRRHVQPAQTQVPHRSVGAFWYLVKQRSFWIIVIVVGLANGIATAIGLISVAHAVNLHISLTDASILLSAAALMATIGSPMWGWLFDRFGPVHPFSAALALCGISIAILANTTRYPVMLASFCVFGAALGALYAVYGLLLRTAFGTELLGRAFGLASLAMLPLVGTPTLLVIQFASLGSRVHYLGFVFGFAATALLLLAMPKPRHSLRSEP